MEYEFKGFGEKPGAHLQDLSIHEKAYEQKTYEPKNTRTKTVVPK